MPHWMPHRREQGSAMLIAVMMLVLMGLLGVAAMETAGEDQKIAGLTNRSRSAFYAAEAGAAHGRQLGPPLRTPAGSGQCL